MYKPTHKCLDKVQIINFSPPSDNYVIFGLWTVYGNRKSSQIRHENGLSFVWIRLALICPGAIRKIINPLQRKPLSCITKNKSIGYILLFWSNSEKNTKKSFVSEKLKNFKKWVLVPFIVKISKSSNILFLLLYLRVSHKEQKNSTKVSSAHFTVTSTMITDFF